MLQPLPPIAGHARQIDSRTVLATNTRQFARWVADYGEDSDFVRVRVRGQFPRAGSLQFIDSEMVEEASKRPRPAQSHRGSRWSWASTSLASATTAPSILAVASMRAPCAA